jgi:hypothetical protein
MHFSYGSRWTVPVMPFLKRNKELESWSALVYQSTYSPALTSCSKPPRSGLESRPALLAEGLFQTKHFKLV